MCHPNCVLGVHVSPKQCPSCPCVTQRRARRFGDLEALGESKASFPVFLPSSLPHILSSSLPLFLPSSLPPFLSSSFSVSLRFVAYASTLHANVNSDTSPFLTSKLEGCHYFSVFPLPRINHYFFHVVFQGVCLMFCTTCRNCFASHGLHPPKTGQRKNCALAVRVSANMCPRCPCHPKSVLSVHASPCVVSMCHPRLLCPCASPSGVHLPFLFGHSVGRNLKS